MATISVAESNAYLDARSSQYNNGYQRWYTGTRPAGPDTALSGNTLLAEFRFGATAFGAAASRVATANAMTGATAVASGTATFARNFKSDGTTALSDMSIGLAGSGAEVISGRTVLATNDVGTITSCTLTMPIGT